MSEQSSPHSERVMKWDDLVDSVDGEAKEKLVAARESGDAHTEATGHEPIDYVKRGDIIETVIGTCRLCGQEIARIRL